MEPVIHCVLSCLALLAGQPYRELARMPDGSVVAAVGAPLLTRLYVSAKPPLLYFSADDFVQAMRGLSPVALAHAVEKRRSDWSPHALDEVSEWLDRRQRVALALAAAARAQTPAAVAAIDEHARCTIRLLAQINGAGRYDDVTLAELLVALIERQALLLAELRAAPERYRAESELWEQAMRGVAHLLAAQGRPEFAQAPPYGELRRAVHAAPADAALIAQLRTAREPSVPWRDGRVFAARLRDLPALARTHRVQTLYLDDDAFVDDAATLTQPQLEQRFAARAAADADRELQRMLAVRRLDVLMLLQTVHDRAARVAREMQAPLARASVQLTRVELLGALADASPAAALERLAAHEADTARALDVLAELARRESRSDLEKRWRDWSVAQHAQLGALNPSPGR